MGQFHFRIAADGRREAQKMLREERPRRLPMVLALLISLAFAYFSISLYLGHPLIQFDL